MDQILKSETAFTPDEHLIVGNESRDDAAVYDKGNGECVISTTDFFMPIVDDPFDFGRIAAVNAISDVYAMGGQPMMAIAVLGWPVNVLGPEIARLVVNGGRTACADAGIVLAGGHSIDSPEPIYGLAVTGSVARKQLKQNNTAHPGCHLFLTKPIGVGILSTAQKKGKLLPQHSHIARDQMIQLNKLGAIISQDAAVKAMTDVTGFGLLGHLSEMCEGSDVQAVINFDKVPIIPEIPDYIAQDCIPGGTNRNWASYSHKIGALNDNQRKILCDPQTSGGLLIAVEENGITNFLALAQQEGYMLESIGTLKEHTDGDPWIVVE